MRGNRFFLTGNKTRFKDNHLPFVFSQLISGAVPLTSLGNHIKSLNLRLFVTVRHGQMASLGSQKGEVLNKHGGSCFAANSGWCSARAAGLFSPLISHHRESREIAACHKPPLGCCSKRHVLWVPVLAGPGRQGQAKEPPTVPLTQRAWNYPANTSMPEQVL